MKHREKATVERIGPTLLPHSDNGRMIILRTFCPFDIDKLGTYAAHFLFSVRIQPHLTPPPSFAADGFDSWVGFFPCGSPDEGPDPADRMGVDILLYFSAAWDVSVGRCRQAGRQAGRLLLTGRLEQTIHSFLFPFDPTLLSLNFSPPPPNHHHSSGPRHASQLIKSCGSKFIPLRNKIDHFQPLRNLSLPASPIPTTHPTPPPPPSKL